MNLNTFKKKQIAKKIERLLKNKDKNNSLQVSKNITSVGIIVDENSNFDFEKLKILQREIASGSKNFSVLTYKATEDNFNEFRGVSITEKDFSWSGKLLSKDITSFLDKPFDMLIDYTKADVIFKMYLVVQSKAKFKVGFANVDDRIYDLMIAVENDITIFNKELIKYLKILNKL